MPTTTSTVEPPPIVHTYAPTYDAIWDEIFAPTCAVLFCHGGNQLFLVMETKELGYESLRGDVIGPECEKLGLRHVSPGKPEESLLYRKITDAPCGKRMPLSFGFSGQLDPREVSQIKRWIELGAPREPTDAATPDADASRSPDGDASRDGDADALSDALSSGG